jgi:hypothetical protein
MGESFECGGCGREYEYEGERVTCWCDKTQTVVVKPCGVCDKPITTAEICRECADESETNAFTHPNEVWERATSSDADQ